MVHRAGLGGPFSIFEICYPRKVPKGRFIALFIKNVVQERLCYAIVINDILPYTLSNCSEWFFSHYNWINKAPVSMCVLCVFNYLPLEPLWHRC